MVLCSIRASHAVFVQSTHAHIVYCRSVFSCCNVARFVLYDDKKYIYCIYMNTNYTMRQKLHPCWFCNNLIKLRSLVCQFYRQLPECICYKAV